MAIIEEAKYIFTDLEKNNNKFWDAQLSDDGTVTARWGRVGEPGTSGSWSGGRSYFDKKCREKEAKGYQKQRVISETAPVKVIVAPSHDLEKVALAQITSDNDIVNKLVSRLAKANVHRILESTTMTYDTSNGTFKTPLGVVDQSAISQARTLLGDITVYVQKEEWTATAFGSAVNSLLMLVPKNIGRGRLEPRNLFGSLAAIQKENDLLDALEASLNAVLASNAKPADPAAPATKTDAPQVFSVRLTLVEDGKEIERIRKKYKSTLQNMHACSHLDVKTVYEVEISTMKTLFDAKGKPLGNVMELWHGTKVHNLLSILKSGLKVAPPASAAVTGKLFGNGIYFSDQSTKSLNYAYGAAPGQGYSGYDDNCFMFLADVAMGKTYTPKTMYENLPKAGYDSTFATANCIPSLRNNEMIVYNDGQANLSRLVEFSRGGK